VSAAGRVQCIFGTPARFRWAKGPHVLRRWRRDADDLDGFYDVDESYDEGSSNRPALDFRRVLACAAASGASVLVLVGAQVLEGEDGRGAGIPAAAGTRPPSSATPAVNTPAHAPATSDAEPTGPASVDLSAVVPSASSIVANGSTAPFEPFVLDPTGANSRPASTAPTITAAAAATSTPEAPRPATAPAITLTSPPAAARTGPPPAPTRVVSAATPISAAPSPAGPSPAVVEVLAPDKVPPVTAPSTVPPVTPLASPPPPVAVTPPQAPPTQRVSPGSSGDHRHDDDPGGPDSPGQSDQHRTADADESHDDGLPADHG